MNSQSYIALVDCDSFFCSCEVKLNPELQNRALCVVSSERGCVISRSKEAKEIGVKMGEPLFKASQEHPNCIYIVANHQNYFNISKQIVGILEEFSPNIEVYSIDEAFVDLTGLQKLYKRNYYELAQLIKDKIRDEVGIPVSIGVSRSKTLAKLASDRAKKAENHIILLGKSKIKNYLQDVDVSEVWGIGGRLTLKLQRFGIRTAGQFVSMDDSWIKSNFGINGLTTKHELLGTKILQIVKEQPLPKSIMDTQSFSEFSSDIDFLKNELMVHIHSVCRRLRHVNLKCKKVGVIVKTKDFKCYFLDSVLNTPTNFELEISKTAFALLNQIYTTNVLYRSIGIIVEDFHSSSGEQLSLFDDHTKIKKNDNLGKAIDNLEKKFGKNIVQVGFTDKSVPNKQNFLTSPDSTLE